MFKLVRIDGVQVGIISIRWYSDGAQEEGKYNMI